MNSAAPPISFKDMHAHNMADQFKLIVPDIDLDSAEVLLRGRYYAMTLRSGLRFHATDIVDMYDLVTQARCKPGLTFGLFLEGGANVSLGGRAFRFGEGDAHAFALNCAEMDRFERRGLRGRRVRKVNINLPEGWLQAESMHGSGCLGELCRTHLASNTWTPTPHHVALAEKLLNPAPGNPFLESLYRESLALDFVAEAIRQWTGGDAGPARLCGRDRLRLRRACDYIDAHQDVRLHLDDVARVAGMSASALQRLFRAAHGQSVLEFARARRLHRAREALVAGRVTVTEAALEAGYSSPANFATAFKRQFGVSPKEVR